MKGSFLVVAICSAAFQFPLLARSFQHQTSASAKKTISLPFAILENKRPPTTKPKAPFPLKNNSALNLTKISATPKSSYAEKSTSKQSNLSNISASKSATSSSHKTSLPQLISYPIFPTNNDWQAIDLLDFAKKNNLSYLCKNNQIQLLNKQHCLVFTPNTKEMLFDGIKIYLTYPIRQIQIESASKIKHFFYRIKSMFSVSYRIQSVDIKAYLMPLLYPKNFVKKTPKVIVIDPGHGGKADGTVQNGIKEKDLALKTAQTLQLKLKAAGYTTYLTRTGDYALSLEERSKFANIKKADLFISLHYNSAPSSQACGIEIFAFSLCHHPSTNQSKIALNDRYIAAAANRFDSANTYLAWNIQKQIMQRLNIKDRGVRRSRLGVLRNLNCPGVLIECGFLSNPFEAKICRTTAYQNKLSEAICNGIHNYGSH